RGLAATEGTEPPDVIGSTEICVDVDDRLPTRERRVLAASEDRSDRRAESGSEEGDVVDRARVAKGIGCDLCVLEHAVEGEVAVVPSAEPGPAVTEPLDRKTSRRELASEEHFESSGTVNIHEQRRADHDTAADRDVEREGP